MAQPVRRPEQILSRSRFELATPPSRVRPPPKPALIPTARRAVSVDALRGFAMFWILGGDALAGALKEMSSGKDEMLAAAGTLVGAQLEHVPWEGVRFYDLILPTFIFVVGVSIVFSLTRLVAYEGRAAAHARVVRRSVLLFVLGLIYYGGASHEWPEIRLLGVLPRIALCYLFASLLFLNLGLRGLTVAFVSLLVGYWALMTFVPVPGIGAGSFERGANLANWVDSQFLPGAKWEGTWDPEGLLSTLPAIATCLLGVFAGLLLRDPRLDPKQKAVWLIGAGVVMMAAGFLWGLQFPVIKQIWTSSFVLVAGGFSAILLGAFHYLADVRGQRKWSTIFIWIGANAITLYFIDNVVNFEWFAPRLVGGDISNLLDQHLTQGAGRFVSAVVALLLAIVLARFLYRRGIFLRV